MWLVGVVALFGTAFSVAGIFGVVRYVDTFWLYRGYHAPVQPRYLVVGSGATRRRIPVYAGSVGSVAFRSKALGNRLIRAIVYLPPDYTQSAAHYPVLYLLHGSPGSPDQFINVGDVAVVMNTLIAERRIEPMIIVMPSGGTSVFSDHEWANSVRPNNDWETYVASEVVGLVDHRYRAIANGNERGIGGLSEGGYGALNIAFHHLGEFDLIEAWSPYYLADRSPKLFGNDRAVLAYNSPALELPHVAKGLRANHAYIWFYDGNRDHGNRASLVFAQQLAALRVASQYSIHPGHHNWQLWRSMMTTSLVVASDYFEHHAPTESLASSRT